MSSAPEPITSGSSTTLAAEVAREATLEKAVGVGVGDEPAPLAAGKVAAGKIVRGAADVKQYSADGVGDDPLADEAAGTVESLLSSASEDVTTK